MTLLDFGTILFLSFKLLRWICWTDEPSALVVATSFVTLTLGILPSGSHLKLRWHLPSILPYLVLNVVDNVSDVLCGSGTYSSLFSGSFLLLPILLNSLLFGFQFWAPSSIASFSCKTLLYCPHFLDISQSPFITSNSTLPSSSPDDGVSKFNSHLTLKLWSSGWVFPVTPLVPRSCRFCGLSSSSHCQKNWMFSPFIPTLWQVRTICSRSCLTQAPPHSPLDSSRPVQRPNSSCVLHAWTTLNSPSFLFCVTASQSASYFHTVLLSRCLFHCPAVCLWWYIMLAVHHLFCFKAISLSELCSQCGTWTHDAEIQSPMLYRLSQPGTLYP